MTQYSKSALARHTRLALLAATVGLTACGGGDDGGDDAASPNVEGPSADTAITTEQAQSAAQSASRAFSNTWDAVSNVMDDSKAADVALESPGLNHIGMAIGVESGAGSGAGAVGTLPRHADEPHPAGEEPTAGDTGSATGAGADTTVSSDTPDTGGANTGSDSASGAESAAQFDAAFDAFLSNPTREGNIITYRPEVSVACSDENIARLMAEAGDAQSQADAQRLCQTLVPNITVVQTLESDTAGTLVYRYRDTEPFVVGYDTNSAYFQVQLAGTRAAVVAMAEDAGEPLAEGDLPSTFSGALRLTATETGATAGTIRLSVPEAIAISGDTDVGEANFALATTEQLLEIGVDEAAGTAYAEMDVGAMSATLPDQDEMTGTTHLWELASAAFTGRIDIDNNQQRLTVTNLGFGDEPTTVRIDGQEALRVALDNFGATVDGNAGVTTLDTALNFTMNVVNAFGLMDEFFPDAADPTDTSLAGDLSINAPAGTQLTVLNPEDVNPVTKVTGGGPLEVQGTGDFSGSVSLPSDSCFVENSSGMMPVAPVQCPQ